MDVLFIILKALVIIVLLAGLVWSLRLRARQKQEMDGGVSSKVRANPMMLNPVLLSYFFFFALFFVAIWFLRIYFKVPF